MGFGRAPVGDRGGAHGDIGRQRGRRRVVHFPSGLNTDDFYTGRIGFRRGARDQDRFGPHVCERRSNSMPLFSGRAVRDIAHRVDGFVGRAAGNNGAAAGKRSSGAEIALNLGDDLQRFDHTSFAIFAAGHVAFGRPGKQHATRL